MFRPSDTCFLAAAPCLLPVASCSVVGCLLLVVCSLLSVSCCLFPVICCLLSVLCWLLLNVSSLLSFVCCGLPPVTSCLFPSPCFLLCLLPGVCCQQSIALCLQLLPVVYRQVPATRCQMSACHTVRVNQQYITLPGHTISKDAASPPALADKPRIHPLNKLQCTPGAECSVLTKVCVCG